MACNGGWLDNVWKFLASHGTVVDTCMPYTSGAAGKVPACPTKCVDGSALQFYKARDVIDVSSNEQAIMTELYNNGPIEVAFTVYQDFFDYSTGVYQHKYGSLAGGHAVELVGWGVDKASGLKYWTIKNSWGTGWGEKGTFRIVRGRNECGIEDMAVVGKPVV